MKKSFHSCFATDLEVFIQTKRQNGFLYESAEYILHLFDTFCTDRQLCNPGITKDLINDWLACYDGICAVTIAGRASVIRQFSLYLLSIGKNAYIPSQKFRGKQKLSHVLSDLEIVELFEQIDSYVPDIEIPSFHRLSMEYRVLFRLLLCCGLRVSEARKLRTEDVDLKEGTLIIRCSKGNKDRIVYLPEDLCELCLHYAEQMQSFYTDASEWFFPAREMDNLLSVGIIDLWYVADGEISMQSIALMASKIPRIKEPKLTREIIQEADFLALLLAPPGNRTGIRDRTIMILLYDSAIRVSELLALDRSSINLSASPAYISVHGKGDKERIVVITEKTVCHLQQYLNIYHKADQKESSLFYTTIKGTTDRMSSGNVGRIINKYADMIRPEHPDLPDPIYPHMFRRTRATNLYQDGVELELVSRILGHSSTQTTRIYATPSIEMMKKAMELNNESIPEEKELWLNDEEELARLCGIR